jgi:hypothetical protein
MRKRGEPEAAAEQGQPRGVQQRDAGALFAALSSCPAQVEEQLQSHPRCSPKQHRAGNIHARAVCSGAVIAHAKTWRAGGGSRAGAAARRAAEGRRRLVRCVAALPHTAVRAAGTGLRPTRCVPHAATCVELPRADTACSPTGKWKCLIELAEQAAATGNEDVLRVLRVLVAHNALALGAVVQVRACVHDCALPKTRS